MDGMKVAVNLNTNKCVDVEKTRTNEDYYKNEEKRNVKK